MGYPIKEMELKKHATQSSISLARTHVEEKELEKSKPEVSTSKVSRMFNMKLITDDDDDVFRTNNTGETV